MSVKQKSKINTVFDELVKYGIILVVGFFLVNFHNDSKSTSKNTAILVTVMTQVKEDLKENKIVDNRQDEDIKKLGNGLISLRSKVDYYIERK